LEVRLEGRSPAPEPEWLPCDILAAGKEKRRTTITPAPRVRPQRDIATNKTQRLEPGDVGEERKEGDDGAGLKGWRRSRAG